MTTTNSILLPPESIKWVNQTTSTERSKSSFLNADNSRVENTPDQFIQTVISLTNCTNDGGVSLNSDYVFLVILGTCQTGFDASVCATRYSIESRVNTTSLNHAWFLRHSDTIWNPPSHLDAIKWIKEKTGFSQSEIGDLIGVTRQTINAWEKGEKIAHHNLQRLLAVRDVIERASVQHPTRELLVVWLDTPRGTDGRTPGDLLRANEINRARLLAISRPSPRLKRAPSWVTDSVPDTFCADAEHRQEALSHDPDRGLFELLDEDEDLEDYPLK